VIVFLLSESGEILYLEVDEPASYGLDEEAKKMLLASRFTPAYIGDIRGYRRANSMDFIFFLASMTSKLIIKAILHPYIVSR
jgi:hypothetical protein